MTRWLDAARRGAISGTTSPEKTDKTDGTGVLSVLSVSAGGLKGEIGSTAEAEGHAWLLHWCWEDWHARRTIEATDAPAMMEIKAKSIIA